MEKNILPSTFIHLYPSWKAECPRKIHFWMKRWFVTILKVWERDNVHSKISRETYNQVSEIGQSYVVDILFTKNDPSNSVQVLGSNCKVWELGPTLEVWDSSGVYKVLGSPTPTTNCKRVARVVTSALQCSLGCSGRDRAQPIRVGVRAVECGEM